jgi:hypothetical protein
VPLALTDRWVQGPSIWLGDSAELVIRPVLTAGRER